VGFIVAGLWPGGRREEALLKRLDAGAICSECRGRDVTWDEVSAAAASEPD
jgi:hypothetical protein